MTTHLRLSTVRARPADCSSRSLSAARPPRSPPTSHSTTPVAIGAPAPMGTCRVAQRGPSRRRGRTRRCRRPTRRSPVPPTHRARTRRRSELAARAEARVRGRLSRLCWRRRERHNPAMDAVHEPAEPPDREAPNAEPQRSGASPSDALFASLYNELHRLARREAARAGPGRGGQRDDAAARGLSRHGAARRARLPRPGPLPRLCGARDAHRGDRPRARRRGAKARRRAGHHLDRHAARRKHRRAEVLSEIGSALDELAVLEPELANVVDLKFFCGFGVAEIRRDAGRVRAHRAAQVGEGPAAPVQGARGSALLRARRAMAPSPRIRNAGAG
jgi:hypothetical protein